MRRLKIFTTIFVIYEFIAVVILHRMDYCIAFFKLNFCEYANYKYFFMCVMIPVAVLIFFWWIPDILKLFCRGACNIQTQQQKERTIRDILLEIISPQDIEKFITAAIIMGIQKFSKNHPKTVAIFDDILNAMKKKSVKK